MGNNLFTSSFTRPSSKKGQDQDPSSPSDCSEELEEESLVVVQGGRDPEMSLPPLVDESPSAVVTIPSCNLKCVRFSDAEFQEKHCRPMPLRHVNKLASFPCENSAETKILSDFQQREYSLRKSQSLDGFVDRDKRWECASPLCHVDLSPAPQSHYDDDDTND